jgi:hypothetical protein
LGDGGFDGLRVGFNVGTDGFDVGTFVGLLVGRGPVCFKAIVSNV